MLPSLVLHHHLADRLAQHQHARQVDVETLAPHVGGHLHERRVGRNAGDVGQDVDRAELLHHLLDQSGDVALPGDISLDGQRTPPQLPDLVGRSFQVPVLPLDDHVGNGDIRPGVGEGQCGSSTHPHHAAGTGHQSYPALQ